MNDTNDRFGANFPEIPGFHARHLGHHKDYLGMARVREKAGEYDRVDRRSARESIPSCDDLAQTFPLADFKDSPDLLLVENDGVVIGYCHVNWHWAEATGVHVYLHLGYILPEWRERGIGRFMVRWAQEQIRSIARAEMADDNAMFATNVATTEPQADSLIRRLGYAEVRRITDMALDQIPTLLVPAALPEGIIVQALKPDHYRPLYSAWKDALRDFWTSTPESDDDFRKFIAEHLQQGGFDSASTQVAWAGDKIIGYVLVARNHSVGILDEVGVRHAWQRRGIGRALLTCALTALERQGISHVRLFTDAADEHGARSLYEQFGFHEVKQHIFFRKPIFDGAITDVR